MNEDSLFTKQLLFKDVAFLYSNIGKSIKSDIDIRNLSFDKTSTTNSLKLLTNLDFITLRFNRYIKKGRKYSSEKELKDEFIIRLQTKYKQDMDLIFNSPAYFDIQNNKYYIKRNSINLRLSGLVNLLTGLEILTTAGNKLFIENQQLIVDSERLINKARKLISITELQNQLIIKDQLGEEAEDLALQLEIDTLKKQGIKLSPRIISKVDVSAGFDIASYMSIKSDVIDKFIEVKSCADEEYKFYISINELSVAEQKGESYYLYLYNRSSRKFRIVQNPYGKFKHDNEWVLNPQVIQVHSINREF